MPVRFTFSINIWKTYTLNRLTKSVLHDLQVPIYIAGCKALRMVSKFVSTPLWILLEDRSVSLLEMDKHYLMLKNGLQEVFKCVNEFMCVRVLPQGNSVEIKKDSVHDCLI